MKPCPFCSSIELQLTTSAELFWVECLNPACGAEGPMRDTEKHAIGAWDAAIRVPTDPKADCHHLTWCPYCNPALEDRP